MINVSKWLVYAAIIGFAVGFTALIAVWVIRPMQEKAEHDILIHEKVKQEALQKADSLEHIVPLMLDSVRHTNKASAESLKTVRLKLEKNLRDAIKKHHEANLAIDTLPDDVLDSCFARRLAPYAGNR